MQLNQTQPSPLTVLLQLNFCYQIQTTVVSPDAHPSSYSSVATTFYPTLVYTDTDKLTQEYDDTKKKKFCICLFVYVLMSDYFVSGIYTILTFGTRVLHLIQIKQQSDATIFQFIILTFVYSSKCFGRFPAHHQGLNGCH